MANRSDTVVVTNIRREPEQATTPTMPDTVMAITPDHLPNVIVQTITPIASILIRSLRAGIQSILATSGLSVAGTVIDVKVLQHLQVREILVIAAATATICALQNTAELLGRLDQKYPMFRGA